MIKLAKSFIQRELTKQLEKIKEINAGHEYSEDIQHITQKINLLNETFLDTKKIEKIGQLLQKQNSNLRQIKENKNNLIMLTRYETLKKETLSFSSYSSCLEINKRIEDYMAEVMGNNFGAISIKRTQIDKLLSKHILFSLLNILFIKKDKKNDILQEVLIGQSTRMENIENIKIFKEYSTVAILSHEHYQELRFCYYFKENKKINEKGLLNMNKDIEEKINETLYNESSVYCF